MTDEPPSAPRGDAAGGAPSGSTPPAGWVVGPVTRVRPTIAVKLVLTVSLLIAFSLALAGVLLERRERAALIEQLVARLDAQATLLSAELAEGAVPGDPFARRARARTRTRVTLIAPDGRVLGDSDEVGSEMESHATRPEVTAALGRGSGYAVRFSQTQNRDLVYHARLVTRTLGEPVILRLAAPVTTLAPGFTSFRRDFLGIALLSLLVASAVAILWARRTGDRLRRMAEFARDVSRGWPADRLPVATRDELGGLAEALNKMAGDLQVTLRRLEDETRRLRTIADGMGEGLLVLDLRGQIVLVNPVAERLLALPHGTALGRTALEVVRSHELDDLLKAGLARPEGASAEITLIHPQRRILAGTAVGMRDAGGSLQGTVLTLRDVTQLKRLEEIRMEFILNLTHELRTPLTAIRGYAETLLDGPLEESPESRKFLGVIHRHAQRLGRLLSDLVDLSNIELERSPLIPCPVRLEETLQQVAATFEQQAAERGIRLRVEASGLPPVMADRDRLVQILVNLADNAVKYTPERGEVQLTARLLPAGEGAGEEDGSQPRLPGTPPPPPPGPWVEVSVADTGIGIPRKELPRLTERFYRVDKARSRDLGGTGLGLSIVKHLVQAHGGRLVIASELGRGTQVRFTLPAAPDRPTPSP